MQDTSFPYISTELDPERLSRIDGIFTRGMTLAQQAYLSRKSLEDYGGQMMDKPLVGTHLNYAHGLLKIGDASSIQMVTDIITEILDMQEIHPQHPHRGNWPRWVGDEEVTDLNSAPFILLWLIPLLILHAHQLSSDLQTRCQECLYLALKEIERLNVSVIYTNIHLKCIFALIAGGQWLEDSHYETLGKQYWENWVEFTASSGAPREYNSATYMGMNLTILAKMNQYVQDSEFCLQAKLMYERFWLHAALHIHRPTRQLAGPHARCYWDAMLTGRERLNEILWRETGWSWLLDPGPYLKNQNVILPANVELALTHHWLPSYIVSWLQDQEQVLPFEVRETASVGECYDLTTYHTHTYALGTSSRTYDTGTNLSAIEMMANHMILHYQDKENPGGWGMMYTRYVVNDQHLGTLRSFSFRPNTNFFDQGNFAGIQLRNKAIALYTLKALHDTYVQSLKTVIIFQSGANVNQVWVNDIAVNWLKYKEPIRAGDWIIIQDGSIYIGLYPLVPTCLGHETPIIFEQGPLGELFLSIYNYRGPKKRFWEFASLKGAYWGGNIHAGFMIEVYDKTGYNSAFEFLRHLQETEIDDDVDENLIRTVTYRSGDKSMSLQYDLWHTKPGRRWINDKIYLAPNLVSPLAVQGASGELSVGSVTVTTNPQPIYLIAYELDPVQQVWIAVNPRHRVTPLRMETPLGTITSSAWDMGRLVWYSCATRRSHVYVDTVRKPLDLTVPEGVIVHYLHKNVE